MTVLIDTGRDRAECVVKVRELTKGATARLGQPVPNVLRLRDQVDGYLLLRPSVVGDPWQIHTITEAEIDGLDIEDLAKREAELEAEIASREKTLAVVKARKMAKEDKRGGQGQGGASAPTRGI